VFSGFYAPELGGRTYPNAILRTRLVIDVFSAGSGAVD
jgi:hypothetical protein